MRGIPGLLVFLLLACLPGCTVKSVVPPDHTVPVRETEAAVREVLLHGDWLVIRGIHAADNLVATATNMPLSHAAIYDARRDEVVEADGSGVHATDLREFIGNSHRLLVIRPMWRDEQSAVAAVERARSWIGKGYNFTGLVGLGDPDRYYCTELAMEAYRPFIRTRPDNPIPRVIAPGRMYHWGRILYDSGP